LPVRSVASVPMIIGEELLGTLTVCHAHVARFDIADQRLLATIASQIGVAVQKAQLHATVRRGKREWEDTFDAIADPIAVFDARGALLRGNSALAATLGRAVTTLPGGLRCGDLGFCGGGCPACAVCDGARERRVTEVTRADGQVFRVTTFPADGEADGAAVVQVAKNVTAEIAAARRNAQLSEALASANRQSMASLVQLRATQAQLLQAEKLSAIGQLVAGVAHELNNPLTSIIGYAQLLEEELLAPGARDVPALTEDARRIARESARAAGIVRNLLVFARRQSATRAALDLGELFTRTLALRDYALRSSGVVLETAFDPGLPPVRGDGHQLQQALLNLLLNAEQAMRRQAVRRLIAGARLNEAAGAVELFVTDSGAGIDAADLPRIFDPFFTTREVGDGAGLGLSICYGIVRDHGGEIAVSANADSGMTFSMLLPAQLEATRRAAEMLVAHSDGAEGSRVEAALAGWGYAIVSAASASDALERYRRGAWSAVLVDAAFVEADVEGWMAARAADAVRTPLILIGSCEERNGEQLMREQASAVLAPPFQLRPLRAAMRAACKEYV